MRIFLLVATIAGVAVGSASAADMGQLYKKAPAALTYSWTGAYFGGYIGGASGAKDVVVTDPINTTVGCYNCTPPSGFPLAASVIGGLTAGFNYQLAPTWLVGLEAEAGYMHLRNSVRMDTNSDTTGTLQMGNFYSVLAARVGYVSDRSLLYVKGGAIFARVESSVTNTDNPVTITLQGNSWRVGYAAGAGWEYALDSKVSIKAEYLYLGLDHNITASGFASSRLFNTSTFSLPGIQTAKFGVNYKLY